MLSKFCWAKFCWAKFCWVGSIARLGGESCFPDKCSDATKGRKGVRQSTVPEDSVLAGCKHGVVNAAGYAHIETMLLMPFCSVSAQCGGCPLAELSLADQQSKKLQQIELSMKVAGVDPKTIPTITWISSPSPVHYRNRMRLQVGREGHAIFFNDQKSDACVVVDRSVLSIIKDLHKLTSRLPGLLQWVKHLEVRSIDEDGRGSVFLVFEEAVGRKGEAIASAIARAYPHLVVGSNVSRVNEHQRYALTDNVYAFVPLGSFLQINHGVNRKLVRHVLDGALRRSVRSFADLYCGSGNFALPLAA